MLRINDLCLLKRRFSESIGNNDPELIDIDEKIYELADSDDLTLKLEILLTQGFSDYIKLLKYNTPHSNSWISLYKLIVLENIKKLKEKDTLILDVFYNFIRQEFERIYSITSHLIPPNEDVFIVTLKKEIEKLEQFIEKTPKELSVSEFAIYTFYLMEIGKIERFEQTFEKSKRQIIIDYGKPKGYEGNNFVTDFYIYSKRENRIPNKDKSEKLRISAKQRIRNVLPYLEAYPEALKLAQKELNEIL